MKKTILTLINSIFISSIGLAQSSTLMETTKDALRTGTPIGQQASQALYGIPKPLGQIEGDNYLDSTFTASKVVLFNDDKVYAGVPARFDIRNNSLEVQTSMGIRLIDGVRIKFFSLARPYNPDGSLFFNTKNFKDDAEKLNGFFEMVLEGKYTLMAFHKAWQKKPSYNEALGVGDINGKIIKEKNFYFAEGEKVKKLNSSKKGLLEAMNDRRPEMEKFFKDGDYDFKSTADLVKIFSYYNQLAAVK